MLHIHVHDPFPKNSIMFPYSSVKQDPAKPVSGPQNPFQGGGGGPSARATPPAKENFCKSQMLPQNMVENLKNRWS